MKRNQNGRNRLLAAMLTALLLLSVATPAVAETFSAIVTSNSMAIYKDAAKTVRIGSLPKNTVVRVSSYTGGTARISYGDNSGYASISSMKSVDSVASKALVNQTARVYRSASLDSPFVKVKAGTRVYVLASSGNWSRVEKDGAVGYMITATLSDADNNWKIATVSEEVIAEALSSMKVKVFSAQTTREVNVYKSPSTSSSLVGTLIKGQVVTVGAYSANGWAYIRLNDAYGFCQYKYLTKDIGATPGPTPSPTPSTASSTGVYVSAGKLPVYKSASSSSTRLGTLKKGQALNLISVSGTWALVELKGRFGYCAASGLTTNAPTPTPTIAPTATPSVERAAKGTVTVASLDVYKTASTASAKLGTLQRGTVVNVIKWNSSWAFIELKGRYGFCAVKGLTKTDNTVTQLPTATPSVDNAIQAVVKASSAKVHRLASSSSAVVGTLKKTMVVNVLSVSGDWAYIELAGRYGFCQISALTLDNRPSISGFKMGGFSATVIYPDTKAYASTSTASASVGLKLGSSVDVYAYSGTWACIVNGANYAFVPIQQLSRTSYSAITANGTALQTLMKTLLSYGYYDGVPSTTNNSLAVTAVKRYQAACGLTQTGIADETLQRILYGGFSPTSPILASDLASGASGSSVTRLQTRLYALGYLSKSSSLDGSYGATTGEAVRLFQEANGITASGTADTETLKLLYSPGATAKSSAVAAADDYSGSVVKPSNTVKLSSTYVTTMPSQLKSTTSKYSSAMSNALKLEHVIYSAQVKLGRPYVYGATGPNSFDCSGLSGYSFKKVGVSLKRTAYSQGYDSGYTKIATVGSLKRGDLVFFNTVTDSDLCDHVGIYLGGGCFIHASSGGHKVVVSNIASGYYNRVFSWGRRIL